MKSISNNFVSTDSILSIDNEMAVLFSTVAAHTTNLFSDPIGLQVANVPGHNDKKYVKWGVDDQLPYNVIDAIEGDEVLAENKMFNLKACYGQGIHFYDKETGLLSNDEEIENFKMGNSYEELFAAQIFDMIYFCWSLDIIILSVDGTKIVDIIHKPAENTRFELANNRGVIEHVFYGNWRSENYPMQNCEEIELLDTRNPFEDLKERLKNSNQRKFGVLSMMPIPGSRYYPIPPYAAIFKGGWLEIKKLIQINKKATLQNTQTVRYHVEIHKNYWAELFKKEKIQGDHVKQEAKVKEKQEEIRDFLSAAENKGKTWISEYYIDPTGKEQRMIRINVIDTNKQGGDWSDDIAQACNMICYSDEIHPNLVGAVPGKTQTNNSGSDKRELFTMKQTLMSLPQQLLLKVHKLMLKFNEKDDKIEVKVPMITLTTLDKHVDAVKTSNEPE